MSNLLSDIGIRSSEGGVGPPDERPLTDEERKLVARLLTDPFAFPQTFKTWLISFLEGSDLSLPVSSITGLSSILGASGGNGIFGLLPAGLIFDCAMGTPPIGTLPCDGRLLQREGQYNRLFKAIGTTYGAGDGSTNFAIPDTQNRALYGTGPGMPMAYSDQRAAANRGGPLHHHHFQDTKGVSVSGRTDGVGNHSHDYTYGNATYITRQQGTQGSTFTPVDYLQPVGAQTGGAGGHDHGFSGSGSVAINGDTTGGFDQDKPSFLIVQKVINY